MIFEAEILNELKQINSKLTKSNSLTKSFINGFLSSVGYLLGMIIITSVLVYVFSQSKIGQEFKSLIQMTKSLNSQISAPLLGQP